MHEYFRGTMKSADYMLWRGISLSYGSDIFSFHIGCTNLDSHHQRIKGPLFLHPYRNVLVLVFLMAAILPGVRGNLKVVFISLVAKDAEHI